MNHNVEQQKELFLRIGNEYCDYLLEANPVYATYLGIHDYDDQLNTLSAVELAGYNKRVSAYLAQLKEIDPSILPLDTQVDYGLVISGLASDIFSYEELRNWRNNPMVYTNAVSQAVFSLIRRDFAPLEQRFHSLIEREKQIPRILESARTNLENPPSYMTEKTIELTKGALSLFRIDLPRLARKLNNQRLQNTFLEINRQTVSELERHLRFLEEDLFTRSKGDFKLGEALFLRMLLLSEHINTPVADLQAIGVKELHRLQDMFISTSRRMNQHSTPMTNMESVLNDVLEPQTLVSYTASLLDTIRQFINTKGILTLPEGVECTVEPMPPFMWGFAAMSTPGDFETNSAQSFYYVEPVRDDWSEEQKLEHLKAMNKWTMESVSIHEAYPGHFVQGIFSRYVESRFRKLFQSSGAHEGWAHYCEEMMVEEGYGNNDPRFLMGFLRECLIRVCRYHVAIGLHTGAMTVEDGITFFKEEGYMDSYTAREETLRGIYDPMYLVYTLGKLMMLKLRRDYKDEYDSSYSLKNFHDTYLHTGATPIPLVRKLLLKNDNGSII